MFDLFFFFFFYRNIKIGVQLDAQNDYFQFIHHLHRQHLHLLQILKYHLVLLQVYFLLLHQISPIEGGRQEFRELPLHPAIKFEFVLNTAFKSFGNQYLTNLFHFKYNKV